MERLTDRDEEDDVICHVLDGGSIIQRLPWKRDDTSKCICNSYVDYVNASTPIPSYCLMVTKNVTHLRRSKSMVGVQVNSSGGMPFEAKNEQQ